MDTTPSFQFPYPDGDDYGAIALYMKSLALDIDSELKSMKDAYDQAFTKKFASGVNTTGPNVFPSSNNYVLNLRVSDVSSAVPAYRRNEPDTLFPPYGWYAFGVAVTSTSTGAVTNNSIIQLYADVLSDDYVPGTSTLLTSTLASSQESNTGGEHQIITGTTYIPAGATRNYIGLRLFHTNTSGRTINSARFWLTFLSTGDVTTRVEF